MTGAAGDRNTRRSDAVTPARVWRSITRNKLLSIGLPVLIVVATAVFVLAVTPVYEASASIRVDEESSPIPLMMEGLQSLVPGGSAINTEMEVLRSRSLAEEVIDSLDLQVVMEEPRRQPRSSVLAWQESPQHPVPTELVFERRGDGSFDVEATYQDPDGGLFDRGTTESLGAVEVGQVVDARGTRLALAAGAAEHEEVRLAVVPRHLAIRDFSRQFSVSRPSREADLLVIRYESTDPELARDVPNVLAGRFIANRKAVQRSEAGSTVGFLGEQLEELTGRLRTTERDLQAFREQEDVIDLEAEGTAQLERLAELQGARDLIESERVSLAMLLREIEAAGPAAPGQPSPYRRLLAFPSLLRNGATQELLRILSELDNRRADLLETRTAGEPQVQVLTGRIDDIEAQLHSIATTYLSGLTDQSESMAQTLGSSRALLADIPAKQITLARMVRQADVLGDIYKMLQVRLKEAEIAAAVEDMSVRVVDPAILPVKPFKPQEMLSVGLALLLGLMLGIGGALLREHLDTRLHTREDLQSVAELTVLGLIPRMIRAKAPAAPRWRRLGGGVRSNGDGHGVITALDPHDPAAEAYRGLRTNLAFASPAGAPSTIVLTSAMPGDGKSTTAVNLAITLAQQGQRVLLVDADLRRGDLHTALGAAQEPGLANVLLGERGEEGAVQSITLGDGTTLDLLASGVRPPNPAELLGSKRMKALLETAAATYDAVVLDAPPLSLVTDAAVLGRLADGVLLVARAGVTDRTALAYAVEQLHNVRATLLGTVLNDVEPHGRYYGGEAYSSYAAASRG